MLAVLVFMVAFFLTMGGVTAIADAALSRKRRRTDRAAPLPRTDLHPGAGLAAPRGSTRAEEILLLAEIEEWMKQQQ